MDLFSKLKHQSKEINLSIEFTGEDLVTHFEHKISDPMAEEKCKICKRLKILRRYVTDLKELVDTGKIKEKSTSKTRSRIDKS